MQASNTTKNRVCVSIDHARIEENAVRLLKSLEYFSANTIEFSIALYPIIEQHCSAALASSCTGAGTDAKNAALKKIASLLTYIKMRNDRNKSLFKDFGVFSYRGPLALNAIRKDFSQKITEAINTIYERHAVCVTGENHCEYLVKIAKILERYVHIDVLLIKCPRSYMKTAPSALRSHIDASDFREYCNRLRSEGELAEGVPSSQGNLQGEEELGKEWQEELQEGAGEDAQKKSTLGQRTVEEKLKDVFSKMPAILQKTALAIRRSKEQNSKAIPALAAEMSALGPQTMDALFTICFPEQLIPAMAQKYQIANGALTLLNVHDPIFTMHLAKEELAMSKRLFFISQRKKRMSLEEKKACLVVLPFGIGMQKLSYPFLLRNRISLPDMDKALQAPAKETPANPTEGFAPQEAPVSSGPSPRECAPSTSHPQEPTEETEFLEHSTFEIGEGLLKESNDCSRKERIVLSIYIVGFFIYILFMIIFPYCQWRKLA
ncbi:uncharacterized protein NEMAJ01_1743 [Nematocida major]|uniref:uncharacterized protein n=1 Tax=Nematocida major TaxID=1912982 RepID=UPI00200884D8|nr:uncharacterized protein NEMAJ01_1743 [Nematocida major]KAH9386847.1 hypothetical protein NEMAJ01_1743 [Nematocida major]